MLELFENLVDSIELAKNNGDFDEVQENLASLKDNLFGLSKVTLYTGKNFDEPHEFNLYPFITGYLKDKIENLTSELTITNPIQDIALKYQAKGKIDLSASDDDDKVKLKIFDVCTEKERELIIDWARRNESGIVVDPNSRQMDIYCYKCMSLMISDKDESNILRPILKENSKDYQKSLEFWDRQDLQMIKRKVESFRKKII